MSILVLALALTHSALASDGKGLPGSACSPTSSTYASSTSISSGTLKNTSTTSSIYIDCPVVDDTSDSVDYATAYVIDQSSTYAVECTLYSRTFSAAASYDYSSDASVGSSASGQSLSFSSISGTSGTHYAHLYCKVAPNSTFVGFFASEA